MTAGLLPRARRAPMFVERTEPARFYDAAGLTGRPDITSSGVVSVSRRHPRSRWTPPRTARMC